MARGDVGALGVALSLLLVIVAVGLSRWQGLRLEASMLWSVLRAMVQLLLMGAALTLVIDPDRSILASWAWVVGMLAYAGDVVRRRAPRIPRLWRLAVGAFGVTSAISLGVVFGLGVFPHEGRTVVPLAGLMIGNAMNASVLVTRRVVEDLRDRRAEVEARIALGHTAREAAHASLVTALRTALIPQIETTRAVGLIFLPGAMTGLILAGVHPVDAVLVQAVVMFLVLGAAATNATVIALGLPARLFTADHRPIRLVRTAQD